MIRRQCQAVWLILKMKQFHKRRGASGGSRSAGKHGQGGSVSGNREVLIRYHTAKSTRAAFIQPSQSEAVLAVGTHHKITGVRSTRTGPSRTYGSGKRVIELEIEVW